ncbi:Serine/threonine-protein kinase 33 [Rhizoclosmatium sp. JEL0117]|nr:Serine/threonine-protein kinase 33 [Rhizoclosmatium sp. JEL0117]
MERNTSSPPQGRRPFAQGIPIAEYDRAITGSTDLSGEKKERIEHHRVEDVTDLEKKYRIGRKLGQLSVLTGHCFACKSLKKKAGSPKVYEQLQREVAIMKLVRHRNIIKLHEVYETPKKIFLVMEHCGAGELDERFSGCTENDVRSIIRKLADAVASFIET